jgi:hypothetical protein
VLALPLALVLAAASEPAAGAAGGAPRLGDPGWGRPVAHSAALLVGMRLSLSALWPRAYDPSRLREQRHQLPLAFTLPPERLRGRGVFESDGDPWAVNVVGHGLFGSEVYLRARQCGHGVLASATATALVSAAWEYGVESLAKRPSAIDLVWTPLGGAVLGEVRHRVYRAARRRDARGAARVVSWLVDPLGEAERAVAGGC